MVNIKRLTNLNLRFAAHLTGIFVALKGKALLFVPVRAVTSKRPTFPVWGIWTNQRMFEPFGAMLRAAKVTRALDRSDFPRLALNGRPAPSARCFEGGRRKVGVVFSAKVYLAPFSIAVPAAKEIVIAFDLARITVYRLAAVNNPMPKGRGFVPDAAR